MRKSLSCAVRRSALNISHRVRVKVMVTCMVEARNSWLELVLTKYCILTSHSPRHPCHVQTYN